eukprot:SM002962S11250  [mRNA]  locus=s2962:668:1602:- [translate_table: standard]
MPAPEAPPPPPRLPAPRPWPSSRIRRIGGSTCKQASLWLRLLGLGEVPLSQLRVIPTWCCSLVVTKLPSVVVSCLAVWLQVTFGSLDLVH